jgi:hypothetical protein
LRANILCSKDDDVLQKPIKKTSTKTAVSPVMTEKGNYCIFYNIFASDR